MTTYRKTMAESLKEVYLGENNLEKMRKASKGAAQTLKMKDGNLKMDSFTASAIMQIYDKINDKNKKTFEKMMKDGKRADILKLQKFAMSKISSEYVPEEFEEEFELDEAKYDLYHKDFSSAMQHAYAMAKKLYGITIDPKEIDDKVATGPSKPGSGKTNSYRLKGDKGAIQVQVYNKGGSKPFELNMYKEEVDLDEGYEGEVVKVLKKAKIASYFSNNILYVEKGDGKAAIAALKKAPNIKELPKVREEKPRREEVELDEAQEQIKQLEKMLKDLERKKKKTPGDGYAKMKIKELLADLKSKKEEIELDEAVKVGDTVKVKLNRKGKEYIEKGKVTKIEKDSIIVKHDFSRTPSRVSMKNIVKEEVELDEEIKGIKNKSEKTGVSYGILKKVYDRGMAAWKTGHRPGTTPQQWAFARINSFLTGGGARKADNDLWQQAKKQIKDEVELDEILTQRPRAGGGRHGKNVEMNLKVTDIIAKDYMKQGASKADAHKAAFKDLKAMSNAEKQDIIKKGKSSLFYMESFDLAEDGHTDVASAVRQCKTVMEDANQILSKLMSMNPEDSLPTWWSNKLAIASNNMNKMRDYLLVPSEMKEQLEEAAGDIADIKKLTGELQNASKMHLAQSKRVKAHVDMMSKEFAKRPAELGAIQGLKQIVGELEKASQAHLRQSKTIDGHIKFMDKMKTKPYTKESLNEQPEHEITVGGYTTKFFYMCGSAQEVMKKNADVEGAEEITKLQDDFYKLEKDVMDAGSATDGQKILAKEIYNKIMKLAGEAELADDIGGYMKQHLDSVEKGDPKPGFGRTDMKEEIDPADVDDDATELDVKAADKNIMMQMRKVISLRGNFKVEFGDKKKMKLPPKIAQAVQKKYNSIRRPADKQKFTIQVSKSYKDMLDALKEDLDEWKNLKTEKNRRVAGGDKRRTENKVTVKETKLSSIHRQLREK